MKKAFDSTGRKVGRRMDGCVWELIRLSKLHRRDEKCAQSNLLVGDIRSLGGVGEAGFDG